MPSKYPPAPHLWAISASQLQAADEPHAQDDGVDRLPGGPLATAIEVKVTCIRRWKIFACKAEL